MVGLGVALSSPDVLQTFTGYHFTVLESEEVNAVSTPGGFVFVTLGTVKRAKSEDELAAILAHEIAHVTLHHGIAAIKSATRKKSAALLVQGVGETAAAASKQGGNAQGGNLVELTGLFASAIQDITSDLLVKGYSRETELDADHVGAKFLKQAGYSRTALASYLQRMGSEGGKGGWYGTHPTPKDRIAALGDVSADDTGAVLAGLPARNQRFKAAVGA
jgi:predicted Zn-dependent protease